MLINSYLNNTFRCTLILLLGTTSQFAAANWDDEWPTSDMEIVEVVGPEYYDMGGWVTACTGYGCGQYLESFANSLNEQSLNLNMQDFKEISGSYDQKTEEEKDEVCGNGYTRREMSEAYTQTLLDISTAQLEYGTVIGIEAAALSAYYGSPLIGGAYSVIVGGLLTQLGKSTTERVTNEYSEGMATCD